jgi:diketogulonate reductase-like aldo/keto reductase
MHWSYRVDASNKNLGYRADWTMETWGALETQLDAGLTKAIGLSNFSAKRVQCVLDKCRVPPAVLQVELHPYFQQQELVDYCKSKGIVVTGYAPLGSPGRSHLAPDAPLAIKDPVILEIGAAHGVAAAQVMIRWAIQRDTISIPKSVTPARIRENFASWDLVLTADEMSRISALEKGLRSFTADWSLPEELKGKWKSICWDEEDG